MLALLPCMQERRKTTGRVNEIDKEMKREHVSFLVCLNLSHTPTHIDTVFPPIAKKQRMQDSSTCFILEGGLEILQTVCSFLALKEALVLHSTCRRLHNDNNNAFHYSCLMDDKELGQYQYSREELKCTNKRGWYSSKVTKVQQHLISTVVFENSDKLRALLRNKSLN